MLIKELADGAADDKKIIWSYLFLIDRCMCSRLSVEGRCTPERCFPALHHALVGNQVIEMDIQRNAKLDHYRRKVIKVGETEWDLPRKQKTQ